LTLHTNGGTLERRTKRDLKGYGTVWCHPEAIASILGLSNVLDTKRYAVTFDSKIGFATRNIESGPTTVFERDQDGLFSAPLGPESKKKMEVAMLTNVAENKELFTKRQIERAEKARDLYRVIGCPSIRDY
jgi:hypothetical protein